MPGSIEDYLQSLLNAAAVSPIVNAFNITLDKRTSRSGLIRGDLFFTDGSRLYFRELVEIQDDIVRLMYSYHYQDGHDRLIFRYDDTPHHTELDGFPHHKHIADEATVEQANPPDLASVLSEIELIYPLNAGDLT
jgi:Family of unknown function (DUF6516)